MISPAFVYDTGAGRVAGDDGRRSVEHLPAAHWATAGLAVISPRAGRSSSTTRNAVNAGGFVNNQPTVDGNRGAAVSLVVQRAASSVSCSSNLAVSVDYVGNRGRDQIDDHRHQRRARWAPTAASRRLGPAVFDPNGELIPAAARNTTFRQVLQYQTLDALNTDYNALEVALEKRLSNRWSGPRELHAGQGQRCRRHHRSTRNPRGDYGRTSFDNRHAFAMTATPKSGRGWAPDAIFRYYSGYPINETIGSDVNGDSVNNDRPIAGVNDTDQCRFVSELDSDRPCDSQRHRRREAGAARRPFPVRLEDPALPAGVFVEIYNLTNRANFGNPTGNRNSTNFMVPDHRGDPRPRRSGSV